MPLLEELDKDKVAVVALAILSFSRATDQYGATVWKGMDWDVMNLLHEKGWISSPIGKQKSVAITEDAIKLADEYIEKHFEK